MKNIRIAPLAILALLPLAVSLSAVAAETEAPAAEETSAGGETLSAGEELTAEGEFTGREELTDEEEFAGGEELAAGEELSAEEETFPPAVTDENGRFRIWDMGDGVSVWITVPGDMSVDEEWTNRYALTIDSEDPDSLNAEAEYYVYDAGEGYQDFNMDDPLEVEASYLAADEELSYNGPSETETFTIGGREYLGASLTVAYLPEHSAPLYTTEYLIWCHPDERTIATVLVHLRSANPEPGLSMEEAAEIFLYNISIGEEAEETALPE